MGDKWVVVQLSGIDEELPETLIESSLRSVLPELEIFIPAFTYKDKRGNYTFALGYDGYVFVRGPGYTDGDYLQLDGGAYSRKVLTTPGGKTVAYVADADIERIKGQLQSLIPCKFEVGKDVRIEKGLLSGLTGKVIAIEADKLLVEVRMPLGSLTRLTYLPKIFAKPIDET